MDNILHVIKLKIEASKTFQYWKQEIGLSFDNFDIVDLGTHGVLQRGKKDLGSYTVFTKGDMIHSAAYEL